MNLQPKISVIIPIYNSIQYLEYCLQSIVNQTYNNLEIICVNDGSTDQSLNKIKEFQEMDNRIFVVNKKTAGGGYQRLAIPV